MMKYYFYIYILWLGYLPFSWANNPPLLKISFEDPIALNEKHLNKLIDKKSINEMILFVNSLLKRLPQKNIQLQFINDELSPKLYTDINDLKSVIPYRFFNGIAELFNKNQYTKKTGISISQATSDIVFHTILHELTHTIINAYQLAVMGKKHFKEEQEIVISAADVFDLYRGEEITKENYWNEHSLNAQHFYSTMFHAYDSNPKQYEKVLDNVAIGSERQELYIDKSIQLAQN